MNADAFFHYKLDIPEIDDQHWELIEILNFLCSKDKVRKEDLTEILEKLKSHFLYEESIMLEINFPYQFYHIEEHKKLIHKLEKIIFEKNTIYSHIISSLREILVGHIDNWDMRIKDFLDKPNELPL